MQAAAAYAMRPRSSCLSKPSEYALTLFVEQIVLNPDSAAGTIALNCQLERQLRLEQLTYIVWCCAVQVVRAPRF
jgi:hypothetical protein